MKEGIEKKYSDGTDWTYLVFLFLITNQAILSLKILGIIFIFILRPNFKFGIAEGRIPKFYLYIIGLSIFSILFHVRDFSYNYIAAFFVGNLFWLLGFLTFHQTRISLDKYGPEGMSRLLKAFSLINLGLSLYQLVKIMLITGQLNPYTNLDFPYGMSTGDNVYGFFMENSYYNMMVSAILAVYFTYKRNFIYSLVSITTLILVFGNFGTLMFVGVLAAMFMAGILTILTKAKPGSILHNISPLGNYGLYIPFFAAYICLFFVLLSPENMEYVSKKIQSKVFSADGSPNNYKNIISSNKKPKPEPFDRYTMQEDIIVSDDLSYSLSSQSSVLGTQSSPIDARIKMSNDYIYKLQGKALSLKETSQYLKSSVGNLLFGAGTARFSSLTAQKMGGFDSSRIFMKVLPRFTAPDYAQNHKLLVQARYDAANEFRSNANWPDSVYNQILGEYGLIGAFLFIVYYLWYFAKRMKYYTYTFWIFAMMIPFASLSYMFEALSIVIIFELLAITNIEETKQNNPDVIAT